MNDSSTMRGPKRASLTALAAVVLGCILLQDTPTAWSTLLLVLGCAMAFSVGWTSRAITVGGEQDSAVQPQREPQALRLVGDGASITDSVSQAQAAMDRAVASERAMETTLADLDRVIESVEGLCVTLDGELEGQGDEGVAPLRKGA